MLVKTPAIKLGVEVRKIEAREGMLVMTGVATAMPCTVEINGKELWSLAIRMMRPSVLWMLVKAPFSKTE